MYEPVKRAEQVAALVCRGAERKYHRFRASRFYGGIATADCVGCCLGCAFCWSWREAAHPERYGRLYAPDEVARRLVAIARHRGYRRVRISGNEPTICRAHLLKVIDAIPRDLTFILETNGILLGSDPTYARELAAFPNLYVRVGLKGTNGPEFSRLTGAVPEGFDLQVDALANLFRAGANVRAAVMVSFSPEAHVRALRERLAAIAPPLADIEVEELVLYGDVAERLRRAGLVYRTAHTPHRVPPEQV